MKEFTRYIALLSILMLTGCDGFLTEVPDTAVEETEAMTTLEAAEEVCLGVYSTFKNPALYSGTLVQAPEVQADLFYAAKGYSNRFGDFYRWEVNSNEQALLDVYGGLYQIVNRCNFFFDNEPSVRSQLKTKADRETLDKYLADVAFMRAYAYSDLLRLFCPAYSEATAGEDMGVPLYLHYRPAKGTVQVLPRSSMKDCYEQVLADLDLAERLEPRKGCNTPFVTQGAILALRSRVLLNMERWHEADSCATLVIEQKSGDGLTYSLADAMYQVAAPDGSVTDEYTCMWKYDSADEIIWKIQFSSTDMGGSIGSLYMGYSSGRYNPNYLPADWLLNSYSRGDRRFTTFFSNVTTMQGVKWEVMTKFPGNPVIDGSAGMYFTNMPKLLRLSEIYLIRAEARCRLGKNRQACEDLTELRKNRIPDYGASSYDDDALMKAIQVERAVELVGEGFRLSDLKRWHLGFERKPQTGTIDGSNYNSLKIPADSRKFVWLIPQHEITASHGAVVQNEQ
ncbi:MAG: RagB/SusD family nutrient uptake outer membrane protein [Bacteroidaceae bacterium]|nr:RagB/SusD family nutrient uptake outer membrane protein [Bacteroidaceae bacterium]